MSLEYEQRLQRKYADRHRRKTERKWGPHPAGRTGIVHKCGHESTAHGLFSDPANERRLLDECARLCSKCAQKHRYSAFVP